MSAGGNPAFSAGIYNRKTCRQLTVLTMISLNTINGDKKILDKSTVLSLVSQKDIIEFYLKDRISFDGHIVSPFREDRNPSFSFKGYPNGVIIWRDWGTGESGDAFNFVMHVYNNCNFAEALKHIDEDLHLGIVSDLYTTAEKQMFIGISREPSYKPIVKLKKKIDIIPQSFTRSDYLYWQQYGISINTLKS